jgi:hypothetical protein
MGITIINQQNRLCMNRFVRFWLITAVTLVSSIAPAWGKIGDCPPVVDGDIQYLSHANYLQAIEKKSGNILWKTTLFTETWVLEYNPKIEADAQMNIACVRRVSGDNVVVTDGRDRTFLVNKVTGKITKAQ